MYDIKAIKAIPVADIARKYGIDLEKKHGRLWGKLRNEKTASFSINIAKNLWYDFGAGKGGSVIDLVMELEGVDRTAAINKLAEEYDLKNEVSKGWHPLTDSQYRELGLKPEIATLNYNYDLQIHTPEQLSRWNEKYGMPLRELAEKIPDTYNKLVSKVGMDMINSIRDAYFTKIKHAVDPAIPIQQREIYRKWAELDSYEINHKVDLLQKAYKGNSTFIQELKVNTLKDLKNYEIQKNSQSHPLSEDEKVRDKIVKVYKKLYNFAQADYLSIESAKALQVLNTAVSNSDNKFLAIHEIKELYRLLGNNLQKSEALYGQVIKDGEKIQKGKIPEYQEWLNKSNSLKLEIDGLRDLFLKCSAVIDGLREASIACKNDLVKHGQASPEKVIHKEVELSK